MNLTTGKPLIFWQVDPGTGEAEDDGVEDEYQLEEVDIVAADYMQKIGVLNFKNAWDGLGEENERTDEYGLGPRESLAEALSAVVTIIGMQPCEVSFSYFSPSLAIRFIHLTVFVSIFMRMWIFGSLPPSLALSFPLTHNLFVCLLSFHT